jgi:hypothetical protein
MTTLLMVVALLMPAQSSQSQTGIISGQLLTDRGTPAPGVRVAAMPVPREGDSGVPTLVGLALTDSNGHYKIDKIDPGTYYVTAGKIDQPTYFPGVGVMSAAKPVLVTAGSSITGIDFRTYEPPSFSISGRAVPRPGLQIPPNSRMSIGGGMGQQQAEIKADGSFEFVRLQAGTYRLQYTPTPFPAPITITITDKDVKDILFPVPPPPIFVTGNIAMEDGSAAPSVSLAFVPVVPGTTTEVTSRQWFAISLTEGDYRVAAKRLPNGYTVKTLTVGATNLLTSTLTLTHAGPLAVVTATLTPTATVPFLGRVVSSRGDLLKLRKISLESGEGVESLEGQVRADGSFAFGRVAPGKYVAVIALEEDPQVVTMPVVIPAAGSQAAEIRIPELRKLSLSMTVEGNSTGTPSPVAILRFTDADGIVTSISVDSAARDMPFGFSLREGQYRLSVSIRQSTSVVKTLTAGTVDLLKEPLTVGTQSPPEIRITLGNR